MTQKPVLFALAVLVLSSLACGFQVSLPFTQVKSGPLETGSLQAAIPENTNRTPEIHLTFGAGDLRISPGAQKDMVEGNVRYNVSDFKPQVTTNDRGIQIHQGSLNIKGIPTFNDSIRNEWDILLPENPLRLRVDAGAYQSSIELGGLSLENVEINDGASDVRLAFSAPNQVEMRQFSYTTGGSTVSLYGLGNANFASFAFRSGAGSYLLDFSGELQRDADVAIESGISSFELVMPAGVNARVDFEGGLSNIDTDGDWRREGSTYIHPGSGPTFYITVKMGAGNLELSTDY
jgi:hypothetical protein